MAASTNATRVFWGTAWTSQTLLARELRSARQLEKLDGIRRAFVIDAERVAQDIPVYARICARTGTQTRTNESDRTFAILL